MNRELLYNKIPYGSYYKVGGIQGAFSALDNAIFQRGHSSVHENVHRYVFSNSTQSKGQAGFNNNNSGHVRNQPLILKDMQHAGNNFPSEVFITNSQRSDAKQASLPGIFCKGTHFNMCDRFPFIDERRQKSESTRKIFICLKVGHVLKDCPSSQKKCCCYCS